jgi:hypothetical protein
MFNLKDAATEKPKSNYQQPGIHENETISAVNLGKASTGSTYLQFETASADGLKGKSPQMFLNGAGETPVDGKVTAWSITARNLKKYLSSTNNVSLEEATDMINGVATVEQLQAKVAALLVGKKFRAKYKGVQTSKGFTIAELCDSESMRVPAEESSLKYDATKDFVPYKGTLQVAQPTMTASAGSDDLPF